MSLLSNSRYSGARVVNMGYCGAIAAERGGTAVCRDAEGCFGMDIA